VDAVILGKKKKKKKDNSKKWCEVGMVKKEWDGFRNQKIVYFVVVFSDLKNHSFNNIINTSSQTVFKIKMKKHV
jgi:hypothetical protein